MELVERVAIIISGINGGKYGKIEGRNKNVT